MAAASAAVAAAASTTAGETHKFGRILVGSSNVVRTSSCGLAVAYKGLNPVLPGHCIVAPTRAEGVQLLSDLTLAELDALFTTVADLQAEQTSTEAERTATAHNLAVHDGPAAGQPEGLPHVHVHVIPRVAGDLTKNDEIYDMIATWSPPEGPPTKAPPFYVPGDDERRARTEEQMADESSKYAELAATKPGACAADDAVGGKPLPTGPFRFGKFPLHETQVFYSSTFSVATVNLKPLCPGHVLCVPKRSVPLMADLMDAERRDLWMLVREVQAIVMKYHGASACKLGVQDGSAAGQSVPHVHVHVLPQKY